MQIVPLLILTCLQRSFAYAKESNKPHIIAIIGDDIGWNDFGFHGSNQIPTPNLDALGYNGVFLNRFYTQAICSPSRAAFMTGKYPIRYGYQGAPLAAGEDRPIPDDIELLPAKLKNLGYRTHLIGKWHLGAARKNDTPTRRGFDTHFGYWNGFIGYYDHFSYQSLISDYGVNETWSGLDLHENFEPSWQHQKKYATDLFTEKSLELIDQHNSSEPMFLCLGHLAGHTGAFGTELGVANETLTREKYRYIENGERQKYAEVVQRMDDSIGQIVKKLQQRGMLENSVVLFLSDNGAQTIGMYQNYGSNYPLKGLKFTLWEGGVRGSALVYSPLLAKKCYVNNHLMHITDLMPTLLHLAGGETEGEERFDGFNQWKSISKNAPSTRKDILLNIDLEAGYSGIIGHSGRYKLLNGTYMNGAYDMATGDSGRSSQTPAYDLNAVLQSDANRAIQSLTGSRPLTKENILLLRQQLDVSQCNGKIRTEDDPCFGECLFDLWSDPCETENINGQKPLVQKVLRRKLNQYLKQVTASRDFKIDLDSDPRRCNNTWYNWLDKDGCSFNQKLETALMAAHTGTTLVS